MIVPTLIDTSKNKNIGTNEMVQYFDGSVKG